MVIEPGLSPVHGLAPMVARLPVILGAGLTGVAISRALSSASIPHVLVGEPPNGEPRLGESINAEGSVELAERFPKHDRFFFPKAQLALFVGQNTLSFDLRAAGPRRAVNELYGFPSAVAQVHLDRIGFDKAIFEEAVEHPCCTHVESRAADLDYHPGSDRILAVELAGGRVLEPGYVFDCSNQVRFVARHIGLRCDYLGAEQRVVFGHIRRSLDSQSPFSAASTATFAEPRFARATSLVRLTRADDGADALAWCIPLGDYVSVGVNVEADRELKTGPALLQRALDAFSARGIDVLRHFPDSTSPTDLRYRHYACDRAAGANWMLAGPSFCQTWFPSGAGVGASLVAARLAPSALDDPRGTGALYQAYMRRIVATHASLEWLSTEDPESVSQADLDKRAIALSRSNAARLAWYLAARGTVGTMDLRSAAAQIYESDRLRVTEYSLINAPVEEQALRTLRRRGDLGAASYRRKVNP